MVKRYDLHFGGIDGDYIDEVERGGYVSHADYAVLQAENAWLKVERVDLEQFREAVEAFRWEKCMQAATANASRSQRRKEDAQDKIAEADRLLSLIDAHKGE